MFLWLQKISECQIDYLEHSLLTRDWIILIYTDLFTTADWIFVPLPAPNIQRLKSNPQHDSFRRWDFRRWSGHKREALKKRIVCAQLSPNSLWPCGLYSLPGPSVHGILQAGILEWVVMPSSRIFQTQGSNPGLSSLLHWQAGSLPLVPPGNLPVLWAWTFGLKNCEK